MSVMTGPDQLWSTMPGWGIFADLTPSELNVARQLRVLRKLILFVLSVLLLACVAGYGYAMRQHSSANTSLSSSRARTVQLQQQTSKYSGITQVQATVSGIQSDIASLMAGDVDFARLLGEIRTALPGTMTIKTESVTLSPASVASGSVTGAASLDTSGNPQIGMVTLTGSADTLDDISGYVDNLDGIAGVVNLVPTSNTAADGQNHGVQFNLTFGLTNQVLSHTYDLSKNGGH